MGESAYSVVKDVRNKSFPPRRLLYVAGAGLLVGIVLTVIIMYCFFTSSQDSLSGGACNTANPNAHTGCQFAQPNSKKTFTIFTEEKKNWYEAMADCHRRGMMFAAIESEEEFQEVLSLINEKHAEHEVVEDFWVSGADLGHNGTFVWMSTGRAISFSRWFRDERIQEPTHGHFCGDQLEHCVELMHAYHYEMNDNCCDRQKSYVCESHQCSN